MVLGLRLDSVADGYLSIPVHGGMGCWTGSGWGVSLSGCVGAGRDVEWIEGSSWFVTVMFCLRRLILFLLS